MASLITNRGLACIAERASLTTPTIGQIQSIAIDNRNSASTQAFSSTMQKLNDATSASTSVATSFNPTPSRTPADTFSVASTVTHVGVFGTTSSNNMTVGGISLHHSVSTGVNLSSSTLVAGIDQQSLAKTTDFQLTITVRIAYSSI